uniref:Uncharacterized protein n=1 Tax=Kalanchoe fedtschenkoi TaxID=63787 RepID=A0A7N0VHI6_KALFE
MAADTTEPSYWLNWRFFLSALWILAAIVSSSFIIWKCEVYRRVRREMRGSQQRAAWCMYKDEAWRTCLASVHPAWLLAFRSCAFLVLLALLVANIALDGIGIMYFYTQWTFTLVTIYFGVGTIFSIYGCQQKSTILNQEQADIVPSDMERGTYTAPSLDGAPNISTSGKVKDSDNTIDDREIANVWSYAFQLIFQVAVGAVVLTDSVFWFLIYPFLTSASYRLHFLDVCMHSVNAVFLLGDTILNGMRFPFFRIAYFVLWTSTFVVVQWIIHACVSIWWPYTFMDLSSPFAPAWYLAIALMHLPCYGLFALIVRLKNFTLHKSFPGSFQSTC